MSIFQVIFQLKKKINQTSVLVSLKKLNPFRTYQLAWFQSHQIILGRDRPYLQRKSALHFCLFHHLRLSKMQINDLLITCRQPTSVTSSAHLSAESRPLVFDASKKITTFWVFLKLQYMGFIYLSIRMKKASTQP